MACINYQMEFLEKLQKQFQWIKMSNMVRLWTTKMKKSSEHIWQPENGLAIGS